MLPYTVNDGSGANNPTNTANWVINVIGVDIVDNASPADSSRGDDVLASIDNLAAVSISGRVPVGGSLTELRISDGVDTVTVPPGSVTINPDGSFTTTADLSGLKDGPLTVTLNASDAGGHTADTTDTITKDTVTDVTINPLLVVNGGASTITGTGEPGAKVTLTIDGVGPVEVTVESDGSWSYTPGTPLANTEVTIQARAVDSYGNTDDASRKVVAIALEDQVNNEPEHVRVYESALAGGTDPTATTEEASATFTLGTTDSVAAIVIGGSVQNGAVAGGTPLTLAQLQDIASVPIAPIATTYGTLTITDYDSATSVVSYTYAISQSADHPDAEGTNILRENIQVAVADHDGDTRVDTLVVAVVDDVPQAKDDAPVTLAEGGVTVGYVGDTSTGGATNLLANDTKGAYGARIHQVKYIDGSGTEQTVVIAADQTSTGELDTQYGKLTVHADGTWSYTSDAAIAHANGEAVSDPFSYTLKDGDGDVSD